jgi:hypothetical protein
MWAVLVWSDCWRAGEDVWQEALPGHHLLLLLLLLLAQLALRHQLLEHQHHYC